MTNEERMAQIGSLVDDALDPVLTREAVIELVQQIEEVLNGPSEDDDMDDDDDMEPAPTPEPAPAPTPDPAPSPLPAAAEYVKCTKVVVQLLGAFHALRWAARKLDHTPLWEQSWKLESYLRGNGLAEEANKIIHDMSVENAKTSGTGGAFSGGFNQPKPEPDTANICKRCGSIEHSYCGPARTHISV